MHFTLVYLCVTIGPLVLSVIVAECPLYFNCKVMLSMKGTVAVNNNPFGIP